MYEDMGKPLPDGYSKCAPDMYCDYAETGTCRVNKCMTYVDCIDSNVCDTSEKYSDPNTADGVPPVDPNYPYKCKLCESQSDCPDAPICLDDTEHPDYEQWRVHLTGKVGFGDWCRCRHFCRLRRFRCGYCRSNSLQP